MGWDGAGMRFRGPVVRACARHHRLSLRHLPHGATPLRGRRHPDRTGPPGSLAGAVWDTGGMNESSDRLAERYGKPIISPRAGKVIAIVAGLLLLAIVSFMGLNYADRPVSSDVLTYEHVASDRIAVEFTVSMDPGTEAVCSLQAMNEGRAQIGFVEATVPAQSQRHSSHRVEIATQGEAVSAEVLGCEPL